MTNIPTEPMKNLETKEYVYIRGTMNYYCDGQPENVIFGSGLLWPEFQNKVSIKKPLTRLVDHERLYIVDQGDVVVIGSMVGISNR